MARSGITGKQRAARQRNIRLARRSKGSTGRISSTGKGGKKERLHYHKGGMYSKSIIRMMTPSKPKKPKSLSYEWDKKRGSKSLKHYWDKKRAKRAGG